MGKMNEAICMNNRFTSNGGGKWLVRPFKRQEFWKCIDFILSAVTYGKKGYKLWSEVLNFFGKYENPKLGRDFCGNTDLYKVCCAHYSHLLHLCLPLSYFIVHNFVHFMDVSFCTYLYFSIYMFVAYP